MKNEQLVAESALILTRNFSLEPLDSGSLSRETLLEKLSVVVQHFLDHDLNGLLNILYRIDVSEQAVKEILTTSEPSHMASAIAHLILERTFQKVISRHRYSS